MTQFLLWAWWSSQNAFTARFLLSKDQIDTYFHGVLLDLLFCYNKGWIVYLRTSVVVAAWAEIIPRVGVTSRVCETFRSIIVATCIEVIKPVSATATSTCCKIDRRWIRSFHIRLFSQNTNHSHHLQDIHSIQISVTSEFSIELGLSLSVLSREVSSSLNELLVAFDAL